MESYSRNHFECGYGGSAFSDHHRHRLIDCEVYEDDPNLVVNAVSFVVEEKIKDKTVKDIKKLAKNNKKIKKMAKALARYLKDKKILVNSCDSNGTAAIQIASSGMPFLHGRNTDYCNAIIELALRVIEKAGGELDNTYRYPFDGRTARDYASDRGIYM